MVKVNQNPANETIEASRIQCVRDFKPAMISTNLLRRKSAVYARQVGTRHARNVEVMVWG
jgi:hypothetical protein